MTDILTEVAGYYEDKLARYGATPHGVDWNGEEGQRVRFAQLCRILPAEARFNVNDLGCGYGALFEYLQSRYRQFTYHGFDVAESMIAAAGLRYGHNPAARFVRAAAPDRTAGFGIASGIFNVRQTRSDSEWSQYLVETLDRLNATSIHGFAFNCLTSYSDVDRMREQLFYADPLWLFDLCKRRYARHVALLHDYGLYEFTLLVRKTL